MNQATLILIGAALDLSAAGAIGAVPAPAAVDTLAAADTLASIPAVPADSFSVIYRLEEIVVYGKRPRELSMVTELRAGEVAARGGGDVAHTLRLEPALSITSGAKAETETRIRGMPSHSVLVLVDGRPVNTGYYGKTDLSMIPSTDIAAVQVIKGPASSAYGPNGMGGVVNVITRSGLDAPGTEFGARFGSDGLRLLNLGTGNRRGALSWRLSGYEQYRDGFALSDDFEPTSIEDGGRRTNSGYHKAGGSLKMGYERSVADRYTVTLGYNWSRREIPPTVYSWDGPMWRRFPEWIRYGASINNERVIVGGFELTTVLYADAQEDRLIDYLDPSMSGDAIEFDSKLENLTAGGSMSLEGSCGERHDLHAGLAYKRDAMDKKPDLDEPWVSHSIQIGSIFIEDRYTPVAAATVTAGVQGLIYAAEQDAPVLSDVCPTLALRCTLPLAVEARGAYSRAVRYPTLHTLYSETSGNPELRPETADKFEAGLERWFLGKGERHLAVEVAWFRSELDNLIYRPNNSQQFRNILESVLTGMEATIRAGWSERLVFEAGYVWIDLDASTPEVVEELAPHRLSLAATLTAPFGTELRYDFSALDERTTYVPDRMLDAYRYHSISISQAVGARLSLRFDVFNVTDADYEEELGYPAPGRQLSAGFDWRM